MCEYVHIELAMLVGMVDNHNCKKLVCMGVGSQYDKSDDKLHDMK